MRPQRAPLVAAVAVVEVAREEHQVALCHAADLAVAGVVERVCVVVMVVVMCAGWMMWKTGGKEAGVVVDEPMPLMTLLPSFCLDADDPHHPLPLLGQALNKKATKPPRKQVVSTR